MHFRKGMHKRPSRPEGEEAVRIPYCLVGKAFTQQHFAVIGLEGVARDFPEGNARGAYPNAGWCPPRRQVRKPFGHPTWRKLFL